MSLGTQAILDLQGVLYGGRPWNNYGNGGGLPSFTGAANQRLSLHTANPGLGGNQTTNESADPAYARQDVPLDDTVIDSTVSPMVFLVDVPFPILTGAGETYTHVVLGRASSGAGQIILVGALPAPIAVATGQRPVIRSGTPITVT